MGKRIIEELATDTIQDNDFILMDNNTTPTDPDDDTAGTRKIRASEFGAQIITVDDELSTSSENPVQNKVITGAINDLASATEITGTASGSIASFDDGSTLPLKTLQVSIEPVQSGSGDPSPENVRPISGWDGANVEVDGVNLWDEEWEVGSIDLTTGENKVNSTTIRSKNYIRVSPSTSYYVLLPWAEIFYYDENKSYLSNTRNQVTEDGQIHGSEKTTPSSAYYMRFRCNGTYGTTYNNDISINYPSTDTSYHAYNGNTYNIAFTDGTNPLTVHGGELDVTSGLLTVDRAIADFKDMTWLYNSTYQIFTTTAPDKKPGLYNGMVTCYANGGWWSDWNDKDSVWCGNANTNGFVVKDTRFDDATEFKTALTGQKFVYELATPQTYQLTPTEVKSLLGVNNVTVDTGDIINCTYIRDANITINKILDSLS